jgi:hypothetical protein
MPLRDHFHPPVLDKHTWDEVHGLWPAMIVRDLFDLLPPGFQAAPNIHLGSPYEVDVSTFEHDTREPGSELGDVGVAAVSAPAPTLTLEADFSDLDEYEVRIYDVDRGRHLVAAIEIVSPSNKDRPETREAFVGKVATLLQKDVCVSIVDLVSIEPANLYADLLAHLDRSDPHLAPTPPPMYAVTLRTRKRAKRLTLVDTWFYPMTVGQPLPTIPIWLTPDLRILLPLESGYQETCRLLRIA